MPNKKILIVLRNCRVFDGISDELRSDMQIIIEGKIISSILPSQAGIPQHYSSSEYTYVSIDIDDKVVMPGLIDAHFHCNSYTLNLDELDSSLESYRALQAGKLLKAQTITHAVLAT